MGTREGTDSLSSSSCKDIADEASSSTVIPASKRRKWGAHVYDDRTPSRCHARSCFSGSMSRAQSTLASLVGVWQDIFGSRYELTNGALGEAPTLNVRTTRQDAHGEHSLFKE